MNFYIGQIVIAKNGNYPPMWVAEVNEATKRIATGHIEVTEIDGKETATKIRVYWNPEELQVLNKAAFIPNIPEPKEPVRVARSYSEILNVG